MTFTEIVARVCRDLNLRGDETLDRVGESVNQAYKEVLRSLGMNVYLRVEVDVDLEGGTQDQLYDLDDPVLGRLVALYYKPAATATNPNPQAKMIDEITYAEMKEVVPTTDDQPRKWCKVRVGANFTLFKIDSTIPNGCTVTVEGEEFPTVLEGDIQPAFEGLYHDMLVDGAKAAEYGRQKDANARALSKELSDKFKASIGELKLRQTLMQAGIIKQGKHANYGSRLTRRGPSINGTGN